MPNVRDHDASVYLRLQGDALSVGGYESNPVFCEEVSCVCKESQGGSANDAEAGWGSVLVGLGAKPGVQEEILRHVKKSQPQRHSRFTPWF